MLRSDAQQPATSFPMSNLNSLDINMISLIQKEIETYDMISLVFLLYEVPDTALERLIVYQRVTKDMEDNDTNLLHDWALHVHHRPSWRHEFLEALVTCQLYSIIRNMGLDVSAIKRQYQCTNDGEPLIHPMKKALYQLCENMTADSFYKLKKTLLTYNIDVTDYETCELVLLELMSQRFITLKQIPKQSQSKNEPGIENLAKIIDNFPEFISFANDLRRIESAFCDPTTLNTPSISSIPSVNIKDNPRKENDKNYLQEFDEVFELFNELNVTEGETVKILKSDTTLLNKSMYPILNPQNVGVCLIINQEKFHPSKDSIEGKVKVKPLDDRLGSTYDKKALMHTMTNLNFEVIARDNLDHKTMIQTIKEILKYRVREEHSMFMLCILSHGTKGHVYAADSIKVKVEDIECLLDSDDATHLQNKPKLLILQACQVEDDEPEYSPLVADSPSATFKYYIKKTDVIIYWATAPNYEAYRHEKKGSIFIQLLCRTIQRCSKKDHVIDIFTQVNYNVNKLCVRLKCEQLPKVEYTLIKKVYLQNPE